MPFNFNRHDRRLLAWGAVAIAAGLSALILPLPTAARFGLLFVEVLAAAGVAAIHVAYRRRILAPAPAFDVKDDRPIDSEVRDAV